MARSTHCEKARREVQVDNPAVQQLLNLIDQPISEDEKAKIQQRLQDLNTLFGNIQGDSARHLLKRLSNSSDALSRIFDCEFHPVTRMRLRNYLGARVANMKTNAPPVDNSNDRGVDNRRTDNNGVRTTPDKHPKDTPQPQAPPKPVIPKPTPSPDVPISVDDILNRARQTLQELKDKNGDPSLIQRLETFLLRAGRMGLGVFAGVLVLKGGVLVLEGNVHLATIRAWSRFRHLGMDQDLKVILDGLEEVMDEASKSSPTNTPPDQPQVNVKDTTRGFAVEDFHIKQFLEREGYKGLPDRWPGIDAVKGEYTLQNAGGKMIKVYKNVDGISIKSTKVSKPNQLLKMFHNDYLPPLRGKYFQEERGIRIDGLKSKALHLVFEEGVLSGLNNTDLRALERTLQTIAQETQAAKIKFKWFAFVHGTEVDGKDFLRNLTLQP